MRFYGSLLLFSICFTFIFSCKTTSKGLHTNITDNAKFFLLPTEEIEKNIDMAQYITAKFGGRNYFFTSWVKADKNAIEMAIFNELGASIGELSYSEDGAISFTSTVIPKAALRYFKPEYIIADFQLCFYDPVSVGNSLEEIGLVLEIQGDNRSILNGNEVIIEIVKTENTVRLTNNLRGYSFTFEGDFL